VHTDDLSQQDLKRLKTKDKERRMTLRRAKRGTTLSRISGLEGSNIFQTGEIA
jgi:hypothetical protein